MTISDHAAAAKLIRAELKKYGVKATVRAATASMTSSVTVILTDELPATRDAVEVFAKIFQYGHFDGMTDSYNYDNNREDLPQVRFVFVNNYFSDELKNAAWDYAKGYFQAFAGIEGEYSEHINTFIEDDYGMAWVHQILTGIRGSFWTTRKPHVSA